MTRLTITVIRDDRAAKAETRRRAVQAAETGVYPGGFLSFSSWAQLLEVFTARRLDLVEKLQEIGPSSLRGLARAVDRDVKRVHEDIAILMEWLVVERDARKKLMVPYDVVHFDIDIGTPIQDAAA